MSQPDLLDVANGLCTKQGWSLEGRAGKGAFKETFRVRGLDGQLEALKLYKTNPEHERTNREIEAMRRFDHPHLSQIRSVGTYDHGGRTYGYATELFIDGGTLGDRLKTALLSREEVLELGAKLISALVHIKRLDLVHRDIKPDNIMLQGGEFTDPVLVDFGLVRDLQAESLTHTFLPVGPGTPLYSSPEQLRNRKAMIGWQSDQFSLGIVLTVCLLGTHPFDATGSNLFQLIHDDNRQALSGIVARISTQGSVVPEVGTRLLDSRLPVVLKLLKPWPIQRFRRGQELFDEWAQQFGGT